jgi:hypothetical protein
MTRLNVCSAEALPATASATRIERSIELIDEHSTATLCPLYSIAAGVSRCSEVEVVAKGVDFKNATRLMSV